MVQKNMMKRICNHVHADKDHSHDHHEEHAHHHDGDDAKQADDVKVHDGAETADGRRASVTTVGTRFGESSDNEVEPVFDDPVSHFTS